MENIKITINDKKYSFPKGVSLLDISKYFSNNHKAPILVALVDNILVELNYTIENDCTIEFIDALDRTGNRIYQKGLFFLLLFAIKDLYGSDSKIKLRHSIDKSIQIETSFKLTEDMLRQIKYKMKVLVEEKTPITRCLAKRREAVQYFNNIGNETKAKSYLYTTDHYVTLYKIKDLYDNFYSVMPINADVFVSYDLKYINESSFVLQFPVVDGDLVIPEYIHQEKMLEAYKKHYEYAKQLNIFCSSDINKAISDGRINNIIKLDETLASNNLLNVAKDIYERRNKIKIVLIAGPSSSGKTTTAKKLSMFLNSFGMNPKSLSIDNYFISRKDTPKFENGDYDYDSPRAVNIELFNKHVKDLLDRKEINIPEYNFVTGEIEYKNKHLKLEDNDILIIEGLHGLNDEFTKEIPRQEKYKIYVSELTDLNVDDHNSISTTDVRLLRRIVRDYYNRGYTAEQTINNWIRVRSAEEKYVFPYQKDADYIYNTALIYEIGVLRLYAEPLLYEIDNSSKYYEEARRLLKFLEMFLCIPPDAIPTDSLLREFIGDSFFE